MSYAAISIGIFIFILAYFTWNAPVQGPITPTPPPAQVETIRYCQEVDPTSELTFTAPQDQNTKCPNGPGGSYKSGGVDPDNIFTGSTTYKLIKKNVPLNRAFFTKEDNSDHSTLASDVGIQTSLDPSKYRLYFPQISGEINLGQAPYSRTRDCGDKSYEHTGRMYFLDYGLAFGLVLRDGKPIEVSGTAIGGGQSVFWLADVFKDTDRTDEIPLEAFACDAATVDTTPTKPAGQAVTFPDQKVSTDSNQLQLEYFVFGQPGAANQAIGSAVNGWVDTCKPAIYLYPPEKKLVNVKVFPAGFLSYTDPPYDNDKGWSVYANPDSTLFTLNDERITNNYLYYESKIRDEVIEKPTQGWVVRFDELDSLYQNILPKLGLNEKQKNDFIEYWNKALPQSPYYFVGVVSQENVNQIERLDITPKPDFVNRVRIYFERLDSPKTVQAPDLSSFGIGNLEFGIGHSPFRVVEWGGMVKNDKDHPFTCSQ